MRKSYAQRNPNIAQYVEEVFMPEDSRLQEAREFSIAKDVRQIQVGRMDALHLTIIAAAAKAKKAVEFGTLAGYSGIALLRGMGSGGFLHTLEAEPKHAEVARRNFNESGFNDSVQIWEGDALESMEALTAKGPFDLAFIDADKANYENYFNWCAKNLRKGGVVLADNCFAFGMIADEEFSTPKDEKIRNTLHNFNVLVARHPDFHSTMLPTEEGLLFAVKVV